MTFEHAYVFREQAQNFMTFMDSRPDLQNRLRIIMQHMLIADRVDAMAMASGIARIKLIAESREAGSTFDGLAQSLYSAVKRFSDKSGDGDVLGPDLRLAFRDILGLPEIPQRTDPVEVVEAFAAKTGGAGEGDVHYHGASINPANDKPF